MSTANSSTLRLLVGFLLAPLVPGWLLFFLSLFGNPGEGVWALKLSAMVGYPAMLALGLPIHLLMVRRRWTSGWAYALAGIATGVVVALVLFGRVVVQNFSIRPDPTKSLGPSEAIFVLAALLGALVAWVFWLIARPGRVDSWRT